MTGNMSLLRSSAALVVVALAAGCSGSATRSLNVHARAPALDGCVRRDASTSIVQVRGSGERFPAAVMGRGSTGVVLANESDLDLCAWLPFAHTLSQRGTRVLLFDYHVATPQSEVAAAARRLRKAGVRRGVLIGASEGAKAAIIAAAHDSRLADGVVALSPERELGSTDVMPSARRLRVPALFAVARRDPFSGRDTPALARASLARARLVEVPGAQHGVALLHGPSAATVAAAVYTFLQRFQASPPRPEPLSSECGTAVRGTASARRVAFAAGDGVALHGDVLGRGSTTVVLDHESQSTLCGWFPYAAQLAKSGYRVLVFDERQQGDRLDLDVAAAVQEAFALGARRVVAMCASLGGAATLIAAGRDCMFVSDVVSVSGETDLRTYGGGVPPLYAVPEESRITAPLLVVGSSSDPLINHAAVDALVRHARQARAVLIPGHVHGWDLLQGATASARIRAAAARVLAHAGAPVATGCSAE
jgi:dienelactone hydrolase